MLLTRLITWFIDVRRILAWSRLCNWEINSPRKHSLSCFVCVTNQHLVTAAGEVPTATHQRVSKLSKHAKHLPAAFFYTPTVGTRRRVAGRYAQCIPPSANEMWSCTQLNGCPRTSTRGANGWLSTCEWNPAAIIECTEPKYINQLPQLASCVEPEQRILPAMVAVQGFNKLLLPPPFTCA